MRIIEEDLKAIHASLRNGLGLTSACEGLGISVQEFSEAVNAGDISIKDLRQQVAQGYKMMLSLVNTSAAKKKLNQWDLHKQSLSNFCTAVVTWECHCKKEDVKPKDIAMCLKMYRLPAEVATSIGMTTKEFWEYIYNDQNLKNYFITKNLI